MKRQRYLIVNADDFGLSDGVNRGISEAHERGIVTSASLMVRWPAAKEAARYVLEQPRLGVGLHVDLGEWICRAGDWQSAYEVVPTYDGTAVNEEVSRQLDRFQYLMDRKPTHLDSHQHVHRKEPVRSILMDLAARLDVPLRHFHPEVQYCGRFYGQTDKGQSIRSAISVDSLIRILEELPSGVTELGCHPGKGELANSMYVEERAEELRVLCDKRVRAALVDRGIRLCSFREIADQQRGSRNSE